jgi:hypothetical protein
VSCPLAIVTQRYNGHQIQYVTGACKKEGLVERSRSHASLIHLCLLCTNRKGTRQGKMGGRA